MTQHPKIVAEHIQYDDAYPSQPLKLQCAVNDLVQAENINGKLITIVRYWMRYEQGNKKAILSLGLGTDVVVNSIIRLPPLRQWGGVFDFGENNFFARSLNIKFPIDVVLNDGNFNRLKNKVPKEMQLYY